MLRKIGINITSHKNLVNWQKKIIERSFYDLKLILALSPTNPELMLPLLNKSKSQLRQDLFVLSECNYKKNGFFVEFGASNGVDLSNTFLLETEFLWTGILAEPAKAWRNELHKNRPNASIETLCVWKDSNSLLTFNETEIPELSTIEAFSDSDRHVKARKKSKKKYDVQTISLTDLLKKNNAPKRIDYLSIDTEGSEFEILNAFDFEEFSIDIITVEHNDTDQRELIFELLTYKGYTRKFSEISDFDDWYVKK